MNRNENPMEGRPRPQRRGVDGLTSTPRQQPLWEKRGGWGIVTMISRGLRFQSPEVEERWLVAYLLVETKRLI